jgi:hypothetical protein
MRLQNWRLFMTKILLLILSIIFIAGCSSTFSANNCLNADWMAIGYADATAGKSIENYDNYAPMCQKVNVTPDQERYQQGYLAGINDFCTQENGYKKGSKGGAYDKSCPAKSPYYAAFIEANKIFKETQERHLIDNLTRPKPDVTDRTGQAGGQVTY